MFRYMFLFSPAQILIILVNDDWVYQYRNTASSIYGIIYFLSVILCRIRLVLFIYFSWRQQSQGDLAPK